jgi:hypothetical protein
MPLQNRVDPFGVIFRTSARGTFLGNRGGALHNDRREIVRQCKGHRWIACVLEFKGRRREVMSPNRYTELFFLDEAVALSAGHRPCAECRRARFNAFKDAWMRRAEFRSGAPVLADKIDEELHPARMDRRGGKVTFDAALSSLPNGVFVQIGTSPYLVWDDSLSLWTPEAYVRRDARPRRLTVTVLTPKPIVECFRHGYVPETIAPLGKA